MRRLALAITFCCASAAPLAAQNYVARADSLFRSGRVFAAETLYYYAVRRHPRDPAARLALGRYLAARGALKVGSVLMEEARYFGGDAKVVAQSLAPVYARLGNYKALIALPGSPLPSAERARAEFLRDNPPAISGPDTATMLYTPNEAGLGRVSLVIGGDTLTAELDARVSGLVLDTSWVGSKEIKHFAATFEADQKTFAGVALSLGLGPMSIANAPTSFDALGDGSRARLGLDLLGRMAPTFDPASAVIVLHKDGKIALTAAGERHPTLSYANGMWLIGRGEVWPLGSDPVRVLLTGARWTLNPRRGEIIIVGR